MKKTTLFTTLALVVIVAIALSTATFAWYTSQSQVQTGDTLIYAAQSSSASLAIDKTQVINSQNTSLALELNSDPGPMVWFSTAAPTSGTMLTDFDAFITSPIDAANKFTSTVSAANADPAKISKAGGAEQEHFYVINTNANQDATVNVNVEFNSSGYTLLKNKPFDWEGNQTGYYSESAGAYSAVAADTDWAANTYYVKNDKILGALRVAVFVDGKYLNTWGLNGKKVHYADSLTQGSGYTTVFTDTNSYSVVSTAQSIGTVKAQTGAKIELRVWFNGNDLTDALSGLGSVFTLKFNAVTGD